MRIDTHQTYILTYILTHLLTLSNKFCVILKNIAEIF